MHRSLTDLLNEKLLEKNQLWNVTGWLRGISFRKKFFGVRIFSHTKAGPLSLVSLCFLRILRGENSGAHTTLLLVDSFAVW